MPDIPQTCLRCRRTFKNGHGYSNHRRWHKKQDEAEAEYGIPPHHADDGPDEPRRDKWPKNASRPS